MDLGIGVYKTVLAKRQLCVPLRWRKIKWWQAKTKSYVGLAGCEEFNQSMMQLVLGSTLDTERTIAIQTPGASGAAYAGDLMRVAQPDTTVWITDPSYVNHKHVMEAAGLKVRYYRYFSRETKMVDTEKMLVDPAQAGTKDVVLLHGCCHNPTGADIDFSAWQAITELAQKTALSICRYRLSRFW